MAYLEYGLHQGEGFIVVTGEVGAGKTTIVRSLLERAGSGQGRRRPDSSRTQLDAEDTLQRGRGGVRRSRAQHRQGAAPRELEAFFVSLVPQRKRALLVVDEAQNLTPRAVEELRMLSNFQLDNRALLQSFLVGQPEFRRTMQSAADAAAAPARASPLYHIGPMERDGDAGLHRAPPEARRLEGRPGLPAAARSTRSTRRPAGIPRRINAVCDRMLLSGYLGGKHAFTRDEVTGVVNEMRKEFGPEGVSNPGRRATARPRRRRSLRLPVPMRPAAGRDATRQTRGADDPPGAPCGTIVSLLQHC